LRIRDCAKEQNAVTLDAMQLFVLYHNKALMSIIICIIFLRFGKNIMDYA